MPLDVGFRIQGLGGFGGAIGSVCPAVAAAGHIRRPSTSANLTNKTTGEAYQSRGEHLYLLVQDGADARRFLYALHDRCWLAGLGWYIVGKAGQLLERSIADRMACAPERLVFEANPDLSPPLKQERREATIHDGAPLDTRAACADLDGVEHEELQRRKAAAGRALGKEIEAARETFVAEQVEKAVCRGMDADKARLMATQWGMGVLLPGVILEFDAPDLCGTTVADILADPARFDGETLADPVEGVAYGRNCAIVQVRDGIPSIFSFAHGGARYELRQDPGAQSLQEPRKAGLVSPIGFTEDALALIFADRHETSFRYVAAWGKWIAWSGVNWEPETTLAVFDMARRIMREAARWFKESDQPPPSHLAKAKTMAAVEMFARSDRRIAATAEQWDASPSSINTKEAN